MDNQPPSQPNWQQPQYQPPPGYPPVQQYYQQGPYYPPMQQPLPQKSRRSRLIYVIIALIVAIIAVCGITSLIASHAVTSNVGVSAATTSSSSTNATQVPTAKHFAIGQTVTIGTTWQVTINSAKTIASDGIMTPQQQGDVYLLIAVSMKNISSQEQATSSAVQWTLRDSTGQQYTETILPDYTPPDGKVEAGSPLRGTFVYEVPASVKAFTLAFESDIISAGQTIFDVHIP